MPGDEQRDALERALGAHYEILRLLGRGGMGAVYLARERALERTVAIKVLPPGLAQDAESRERFRREARTAANLTHPNIVPLHAFGDVDGMLYFVMGYVRGESLASQLKREQRISPDAARRILGELADALDYAHRQGVVHRDIKPDNVLLDDETGRPMLTDFGVAKARASGATLTEAGMIVGTPHYMSPEQASGERTLDGRSDIYSLGVMGYLMLAGRLPFDGDSLRDVLVKHVTQEAPPLAALAPETPLELVEAVNRCLAKDPANRWPDARSLRDVLGTTGQDVEDLHPVFRRLQGWWVAAGLWAVGGALACWGILLTGLIHNADLRDTIPVVYGAGLLGQALTPFIARWSGNSWSAIRHRMTLAPRWWPYWYPRRWREPGDVWDRLPRFIQWIRGIAMAGYGALGVVLLMLARTIGNGHVSGGALGWIETVIGPPFAFTLMIGPPVVAQLWGKRRGLTDHHAQRFAFTPTSRIDFWRKPMFASLLLPPNASSANALEPRGPQGYLDAVATGVAELAGPARELGSKATAAARQVVDALALLDAELANLARDANPTELAQVEHKLTALGDAGGDNDARRKMRVLLDGQRDLLHGLTAQLDAAQQRRTHLLDLLRTLWLQVANLRAEAAKDALAETAVSGKIRAACDEIERYVDAAATVRVIAPPAND